MKELAPLLTLALSSFENRRPPAAKTQAQEGLQKLGSLAAVTDGSLPRIAPPASTPTPAIPPASNSAAATSPAPLAPVDYASRTEDYQPALKDRSVIEALLDFHRKSSAPSSAPLAGFRAEHVPKVASTPKPRGPKVFRPK